MPTTEKEDRGIRFVLATPKEGPQRSVVQTIIFQKNKGWSITRARAWLRRNDFVARGKVDETSTSYRFKQREVNEFERDSFRTINPDADKAEANAAHVDTWIAAGKFEMPVRPICATKEAEDTVTLSAIIKKVDEDKRLVFGEVYAPEKVDTQGDFMTAAEIEKMAHGFMRNLRQEKVDLNHDNNLVEGAVIVESWIAREDDQTFIAGSWVVGMHIQNDEIWAQVKSGELNGFSLEAMVAKERREVVIELEQEVRGTTEPADEHTHEFILRFDDDGTLLEGRTNEVDGHFHEIRGNTVTEEAGGHTHRYSFVEAMRVVVDG